MSKTLYKPPEYLLSLFFTRSKYSKKTAPKQKKVLLNRTIDDSAILFNNLKYSMLYDFLLGRWYLGRKIGQFFLLFSFLKPSGVTPVKFLNAL